MRTINHHIQRGVKTGTNYPRTFIFSTSVELDPKNVRPSVRPNATMIPGLQVYFDGEFMYLKSYILEK